MTNALPQIRWVFYHPFVLFDRILHSMPNTLPHPQRHCHCRQFTLVRKDHLTVPCHLCLRFSTKHQTQPQGHTNSSPSIQKTKGLAAKRVRTSDDLDANDIHTLWQMRLRRIPRTSGSRRKTTRMMMVMVLIMGRALVHYSQNALRCVVWTGGCIMNDLGQFSFHQRLCNRRIASRGIVLWLHVFLRILKRLIQTFHFWG